MISRKRLSAGDWLTLALLVLVAIWILFPFYWMLVTAVKPSPEVLTPTPRLWPSQWQWSNFTVALQKIPFMQFVKNSLIVASVAVVLTVAMNSLAGFTFAKYRFKGRDLMFMMVLATLMVPVHITMAPLFYILAKLGWLNTYAGLIVPRLAEPFGLFLSRQFMLSIPDELLEAARVDGAGELRIFGSIVLPNSKPLIAVLVIFTFMWRWNDLVLPLMVITEPAMRTVQLGLSQLRGLHYVEYNDLMAVTLLSIIPIQIVFLIFQRYFVQGITVSGMKN